MANTPLAVALLCFLLHIGSSQASAPKNDVCKLLYSQDLCETHELGCFWCPKANVCRASEPKCPTPRRPVSEAKQDQWTENLGRKDLAYLNLRKELLTKRANYILEQQEANAELYGRRRLAQSDRPVITIPCVVHVLYNDDTQNIPDNRIQAQMLALNEDFNLQSARAASQLSSFGQIFGFAPVETRINFKLQEIKRVKTSKLTFDTSDKMKFTSQGGSDAVFPKDSSGNIISGGELLNIWICELSNGILGYAQFPFYGAKTTDGVVVTTGAVGGPGAEGTDAPFHLGATLTHEVGHWLNLYHIWGDGGCSVDDEVTDTPRSDAANEGCPTAHSSCNTRDMVQNFMDYTEDNCMFAFTPGQQARMFAALGLGPDGIPDPDIGNHRNIIDVTSCASDADCFDDGLACNGVWSCDASSKTCRHSGAVVCQAGEECTEPTGACVNPCAENPATCDQTTLIAISFRTDKYPQESSYKLVRNSNNQVLLSAALGSMTKPLNTYTKQVRINRGQQYTLVVEDEFGDGICCLWGLGAIKVVNLEPFADETSTLNVPADFKSSTTFSFTFQRESIPVSPSPAASSSISKSPAASLSSSPSKSKSPAASTSRSPASSSSQSPAAASSSRSPDPSSSSSRSPNPSTTSTRSPTPSPSPDPCANKYCANGGTCYVQNGATQCSCVGDWLPETDCTQYRDPCDVATAADIDGLNPCFPGSCQSLGYQTFVCDCGASGFTGEWCDEDVKECQQVPAVCGENALCVEQVPGYDCYCKEGYGGEPPACTDLDECRIGHGPCHTSATCVNTIGSYECTCAGAGSPDPVTGECKDINQCQKNPLICGSFMQGAECINHDDATHPDGYECACKRGVKKDGTCRPCKSFCKRHGQCRECDPSPEADLYQEWQGQGGWQAMCSDKECYYYSDVQYTTFRFIQNAGEYDFLSDNDFEQVLCEDAEEDEDGDNICDSLDECPDSDDKLDLNENSVPDGCDPCFLKPCTTDEICLVYKDSLHVTRKCVPKQGSDTTATSLLFKILKQDSEPEQFAGLLTEVFAGILNQPSTRVSVYLDDENQYDTDFQIYTVLLLPGPLGGPPVLSAGTLHSQLENALRFQFFAQYTWGSTVEYSFDREVLVGWCEEDHKWRAECASYQMTTISGDTATTPEATQTRLTALYVIVGAMAVLSVGTFVLMWNSRQELKNATGYQAYRETQTTQTSASSAAAPSAATQAAHTHSPWSSPLATRRRVETVLATPLDMDDLIADRAAEVHHGTATIELSPARGQEEPMSPGLEPPSPVPQLEQAVVDQ